MDQCQTALIIFTQTTLILMLIISIQHYINKASSALVYNAQCLDASLSCVYSSIARQCLFDPLPAEHQRRGAPVGPRKRPPLAACFSAPLRRQSVSQLTIPLCYCSSWPGFLLAVPESPFDPLAKGPHA